MVTLSSKRLKAASIAVAVGIGTILLTWILIAFGLSNYNSTRGYSGPLSSIPNTTNPGQDVKQSNSDKQIVISERELADREFIRLVVPLFAQWSPPAIESYFSATTRMATTDTELSAVLDVLGTRLGHLQYFDVPQQVAYNERAANSADDQSSAYEFLATFDKGVAKVSLVLTTQGSKRYLYSINLQVVDNNMVTYVQADT